MQGPEYLNIRITNKSRIPLLLKEIFVSNKQIVRLFVAEPVEWMRNETQLRFLKHKIEEQGKKVVIATNNQDIRVAAQNASIDIHSGKVSKKINESMNEAQNITQPDNVVTKQRSTAQASVTITQKDAKQPSKERVVVKSEYELSEKNATGRFSFFPKKGSAHTFTLKKQFSKGRFLKSSPRQSNTKERANNKGKRVSVLQLLIQRKKLTIIGVSIIALFVLLIFFATSVLPSAKIQVTPHTREQVIAYNFIANANISTNDPQQNSIPSQILASQKEKTYRIATSGEEDLQEYAEGELTVYNESESPQTLVATTRFVSPDGKIFRSLEQVIVPAILDDTGAPGSIQVQVRASEPGEEYNIGATDHFSLPGLKGHRNFLRIYGRSKQPMTGGVVGIRKVVMQEDIQKIETRAREELFGKVQTELRNKIPDDFIVIEDTLRSDIKEFDANQELGGVTDELVVRVVARARIVLIRENDVKQIFNEYLTTQDLYDNATEEPGGELSIDYAVNENDYTQGITRLTMNATQSFRRIVNTDLLFSEIAGKKDIEVRRILAGKEEFQRVHLRFWPFWVNKIPSNKQDVEFDIQYID